MLVTETVYSRLIKLGNIVLDENKMTQAHIAYSVNRSMYNVAQCTQIERLPVILAQICDTLKDYKLDYRTGRRPFPLRDMTFELGLRALNNLSYRKSIGAINNCNPELLGRQRSFGHYSTMSNFLRQPALTTILRNLIATSCEPLARHCHFFAIDASGFSSSQKVWAEVMRGEVKTIDYSVWQKLHIIADIDFKIITDAIVQRGNDNVNFRNMLTTTSRQFKIKEVYADALYCTHENYKFVNSLGADAFMPFKKNAIGRSRGSGEWRRKFLLFTQQPDEFYKHYNGRSSIETVMYMLKANLAHRIRSRDETAQKNEVLLKVLCHNLYALHQANRQFRIDIDFRPLSEREMVEFDIDELELDRMLKEEEEEVKRRKRLPL